MLLIVFVKFVGGEKWFSWRYALCLFLQNINYIDIAG